MAGSLGSAYIQIIPSAEGIKGSIASMLAPEAKSAGMSVGRSISSTIGESFKAVGSGLTKYVTKPAVGAVTALSGATLFSGWKRMTAIDNAKVKLSAIGNDAKAVEQIAEAALASVKGTAYGMDAAMTTAASAVAAGIDPEKQLAHYLTTVADAAAVAGTDMASMGAIFNKVATSGKAHNDVLGQMADAGIPIYQYLADQMGVTADKVFDMASAGEVGLADFEAAVSSHIGNSAKTIGSSTITGAMSNVIASVSRIGANFLGSADDADSFAGKVLPMLNSLMESLEPIEDKAKKLGESFAKGFEKFADIISGIPPEVLAGIAGALVSMGPALSVVGGIMAKIGPLTATLTAVLGGPLAGAVMTVAGVVAGLAAAFILVYAKSESFRNAVGSLVQALAPVFVPAINAVIDCVKVLITEVLSAAGAIGNALAPVIKLLTPVLSLLAKVVSAKLQFGFKLLGAVIKSVSAAIKAVAAIVQGVFTGINQTISKSVTPVKKAGAAITKILNFAGLTARVKSVFTAVKNAMEDPVRTASNVIKGIVNKIKGFFHFSVSAPHIPLPHFSISPAGWNVGQLVKGKIPSLSVRWYRQAMDEPYMFSRPTLFGAGEAGDEIMYGRSNLMSDIKEAVGGGTHGIVNYFTINESDNAEEVAAEVIYRIRQELVTAR